MRMRKKKHGEERISTLSELFVSEENLDKIDTNSIFQDNKELRLEIGCGKGSFIREISKRENGYNYIAVEKMSDVIIVAAEKYAMDRNLGGLDHHGGWLKSDGVLYKDGAVMNLTPDEKGNVRFFVGDASYCLDKFPSGLFESIYINFCDPWDKKGYTNRRLTSPGFLEKYIRVLKPGGYLKFKTDNSKLYEYSKEVIPENGFKIVCESEDLHASEYASTNIETEYEKAFSDKGFAIKYILAVKI